MQGIVYYSKNGNTEILAELIAEKLGAKLIKLEETKKRRGIIGFIKSGYQAVNKKCSELIGTPWEEIKECDEIYLCTPVWAGSSTPAMNTFMEKADLKGKTVNIATVMADTKLEGAQRVHEYMKSVLNEKGAAVKNCIALSGTSPLKQGERQHIQAQFEKLV
ncbi:MAG: NAD(P)H-dependent oxidoreductase [Clostridia bacterium]|nr:NAD(P)H-dependent oxidoreductase [Clostridia bacterium]